MELFYKVKYRIWIVLMKGIYVQKINRLEFIGELFYKRKASVQIGQQRNCYSELN
jgi:hypothetical protein